MNPVITIRDIEIIQFIFEQRAVSAKLLAKLFFKSSRVTAKTRLSTLEKRGYLKKGTVHIESRPATYFQITDKSLQELKPKYKFQIDKSAWRSDSISHDIDLAQIRKWLEASKLIEEIIPECVLQSCSQFQESDAMREFVSLNSDAYIRMKGKNRSFEVALEYEASGKKRERYRKKLSDYYLASHIAAVLYICDSKTTAKAILAKDKEVIGKKHPKVYVTVLSELQNLKSELEFLNSISEVIRIRIDNSSPSPSHHHAVTT